MKLFRYDMSHLEPKGTSSITKMNSNDDLNMALLEQNLL